MTCFSEEKKADSNLASLKYIIQTKNKTIHAKLIQINWKPNDLIADLHYLCNLNNKKSNSEYLFS